MEWDNAIPGSQLIEIEENSHLGLMFVVEIKHRKHPTNCCRILDLYLNEKYIPSH